MAIGISIFRSRRGTVRCRDEADNWRKLEGSDRRLKTGRGDEVFEFVMVGRLDDGAGAGKPPSATRGMWRRGRAGLGWRVVAGYI